jgi:hypothetical protein
MVLVEPVEPGGVGRATHSTTPAAVLGIAAALFGRAPEAVLVTFAAPEMGLTEEISAHATAAAAEATAAVRELVGARP